MLPATLLQFMPGASRTRIRRDLCGPVLCVGRPKVEKPRAVLPERVRVPTDDADPAAATAGRAAGRGGNDRPLPCMGEGAVAARAALGEPPSRWGGKGRRRHCVSTSLFQQ